MQFFAPYKEQTFDIYDFSHTDQEGIASWETAMSREVFPVLDAPLYRFSLFRTGESAGGFFIKLHHIISDGWTQMPVSYTHLLIVIFPLMYVVSASFSDPSAVVNGKVWIWPVNPTLKGYQAVFKNPKIWTGFLNSFFYVIVGTTINIVVTVACAYPLSRKEFTARNVISALVVFTMYFSGGLIPTYLLVKNLGILNTRWALLDVYKRQYMSSIALKNISLAPGASLCTLEEGTPDGDFPGRIRKKLLCYGDSITQGYDALHPSQGYAVRLARYFDWELWNAGLSGYIFDAGLLDEKLPFQPDIVTVAFGTNDWNWAESKEEAVRNAERYFDKIMELYPGRPIFYFSPLWRGDTGVPTKAGEFRPFCLALLNAAKERGIETIDGYLAAPHKEDALADGILHPNDEDVYKRQASDG